MSPPSAGAASPPLHEPSPPDDSSAAPSSAAGASELHATPKPARPAAAAKINNLFFNPVFIAVSSRELLFDVPSASGEPIQSGRYTATVFRRMGDPMYRTRTGVGRIGSGQRAPGHGSSKPGAALAGESTAGIAPITAWNVAMMLDLAENARDYDYAVAR